MGTFGIIELQSTRHALKYFLGGTRCIPTFEAGVVLHADPGEHGNFFSA
jgi:hypothetical protein